MLLKYLKSTCILFLFCCLPLIAADSGESLKLEDGTTASIFTLKNNFLSVSVVPDLGGKVISIKDIKGFEYLSRSSRPYKQRTEQTTYGVTEFDGIDECFPTVAGCTIDKEYFGGISKINDHGFLFNCKWSILNLTPNSITLKASSKKLPFTFTRTIILNKNIITFSYDLKNLTDKPLSYMYVFHPLFKAVDGIKVELEDNVSTKIMYSADNFIGKPGHYYKWSELTNRAKKPFKNNQYKSKSLDWYKYVIASPEASTITMSYPCGNSVSLKYNTKFFPYFAVWASCGTEGGLEHIGLEPATNDVDSLKECIQMNKNRTLSANTNISWSLQIICNAKK